MTIWTPSAWTSDGILTTERSEGNIGTSHLSESAPALPGAWLCARAVRVVCGYPNTHLLLRCEVPGYNYHSRNVPSNVFFSSVLLQHHASSFDAFMSRPNPQTPDYCECCWCWGEG